MCCQDSNEAPLKLSSLNRAEVPWQRAAAAAKGYSTAPEPWVAYQPSKPTLLQPPVCSNCRILKHALLFIAAVAVFSPIMISFTGPLQIAVQPAVEITIRLLFYSAACFPVAGIAASYDILRKQPYRKVCVFCSLHAVGTAVALRGLSCLHSAALPSNQTAESVEFWAHCVHGVLLQPAMWITGGDLDDFPFSEDARVQMWMLCMLCSAVLGLSLGFGLGKATENSSTGCSNVKKATMPDIYSLNYLFAEDNGDRKFDKWGEGGNGKSPAAAPAAVVIDPCLVQHRKLSHMEAGFISACSLSGFWLLLTVVGTFATAV